MADRTETGLDHVGFVSGDLGALARLYEKLGFRLTSEQRQSGPVRPGEQPSPWGTANRCAMLRQGYVELLGIVDPGLFDNQIGAFVARGEGVHILAFSVGDAAAELDRLAGAGFPDLAIRPLIRGATTPEGERQVSFLRIPLPAAELHGGRVQLIEHQSDDILWQAALMEHPNRAVALTEVVVRLADLDAGSDVYRRALAAEPESEAGGEALRFRLAAGELVLATDEGCHRLLPADLLPQAALDIVAVGIRTDDGARAFRRHIEAAALPFREVDGRVMLGAGQAGGALLWAE